MLVRVVESRLVLTFERLMTLSAHNAEDGVILHNRSSYHALSK
jgi:hypothetical protein